MTIREKYRGIRPAAGYPACPDQAEKRTLFDLLDAENNAGIELTESFAMHPGSSVSGLYFSHPQTKYFGVGQIGRDQVLITQPGAASQFPQWKNDWRRIWATAPDALPQVRENGIRGNNQAACPGRSLAW